MIARAELRSLEDVSKMSHGEAVFEVGSRVSWSGSRWRVASREDGFVRLVRVSSGPGALSSRGDSLVCEPSVLD